MTVYLDESDDYDFTSHPAVQQGAKNCQYCFKELGGPCKNIFGRLYLCAMDHDKKITAWQCHDIAKRYLDCVETKYDENFDKCPMYTPFLKSNILKSPCKQPANRMLKNCQKGTEKGDTLYCRLAKSSLAQCIRQYEAQYDFRQFWIKHSQMSHVNVSDRNKTNVSKNTGVIHFVPEKLKG